MSIQVVVVKRRTSLRAAVNAPGVRTVPARPPSMNDIATALDLIRERVRNNKPRHNKPEAFHEEKSEITGDITEVINAVRAGRPIKLKDR